jgi:hypothetical protein
MVASEIGDGVRASLVSGTRSECRRTPTIVALLSRRLNSTTRQYLTQMNPGTSVQ